MNLAVTRMESETKFRYWWLRRGPTLYIITRDKFHGGKAEMTKSKADTLKRLRSPGVLFRLDGSAEVFYIEETELDRFKLPESFQVGGKGDPDLFQEPEGGGKMMTGDELQRELNKTSLFRKTNLLNAFYCDNGPFIQGEDDDKVRLVEAAGKGNKPLTRFPSL